MKLTDQEFAMHWGIPYRADFDAAARYASLEGPSIEIIHSVNSALNSPSHRTRQLKKVAKMLIAIEVLLDAFQRDSQAHEKHVVSTIGPLPDVIESMVLAGDGPKVDVFQKVVAFVETVAPLCPDRQDLLRAVELMSARSLISDHEATLAPMTL